MALIYRSDQEPVRELGPSALESIERLLGVSPSGTAVELSIQAILDYIPADAMNQVVLAHIKGYQDPSLSDDQDTLSWKGIRDYVYSQRMSGPQGYQGNRGYQGNQGERGFQGYQGNRGYQGYQGNRGFQGERGFQGYQGNPGEGFKIDKSFTSEQEMRNYATPKLGGFYIILPNDPTVQNYGYVYMYNGSDYVFVVDMSVTGLRGFQGYQGVPGSNGDRGYQGVPGNDGQRGYQGIPGTNGDRGYQGVPGTNGSRGYQGIPGTNGSRGYQGIPGTNGSRGYQGVPGNDGQRGYQGDIGPTGPTGPTGPSDWVTIQGIFAQQGITLQPGSITCTGYIHAAGFYQTE